MRRTLASDSFTRADANPLSGSWTRLSSAASWNVIQLVSNQIEPGGGSTDNAAMWYNGITWPNDQWSQVTVKSLSNAYVGIHLRANMSGAATCYHCVLGPGTTGSGSIPWNIYRINSGTFTGPLASGTTTIAANDTVSAEVIGSVITLYKNNVALGSAVDTNLTSGAAGVLMYPNSGASSASIADDWTGGDFSGITYKQSANASSGGSTALSKTITFPASNVAGDFLVLVVRTTTGGGGFPHATTITDSLGNTWHKAISTAYGPAAQQDVWYVENCAAGSNTVTLTTTLAVFWQIVGAEYSNVALSGSLDQDNFASTTSTTPNSGSVTTTLADELIIGGVSNETANSLTLAPGTGYTERNNSDGNVFLQDMIVSATGSYSSSGTYSSNVWWGASIATFKLASAGVVGRKPVVLFMY